MNKYVRDQILIPIGIPIAVLAGMGFVIVNLSRVLLAVNQNLAVVIGTAVAVAVLFGSAYAASPRHRKRSRAGISLLVVFGLGLGIAGAWAADHGERKIEKHTTEATASPQPTGTPTAAPAQADVTVELAAKDIKFDKTQLELPSGKTVDVHVTNQDATLHNFAMFRDEAKTDVVFRGETFTGPGADKHYIFEAPAPGTYHFHCDVHPTMEGTVKVT